MCLALPGLVRRASRRRRVYVHLAPPSIIAGSHWSGISTPQCLPRCCADEWSCCASVRTGLTAKADESASAQSAQPKQACGWGTSSPGAGPQGWTSTWAGCFPCRGGLSPSICSCLVLRGRRCCVSHEVGVGSPAHLIMRFFIAALLHRVRPPGKLSTPAPLVRVPGTPSRSVSRPNVLHAQKLHRHTHTPTHTHAHTYTHTRTLGEWGGHPYIIYVSHTPAHTHKQWRGIGGHVHTLTHGQKRAVTHTHTHTHTHSH